MPYKWVDAALYLEFNKVAIYHCYDDSDNVRTFWYTTDPIDCNIDNPDSESPFDIRDLPDLNLDVSNEKNHPPIIKNAIQRKLITGSPAMIEDKLQAVIEVRGGVAEVTKCSSLVEVEILDLDNDNCENCECPRHCHSDENECGGCGKDCNAGK